MPVKYQGERPTIKDFVSALVDNYLAPSDEEEEDVTDESFNSFAQNWTQYIKGRPLDEGNTITVDLRNGFVLYESKYDDNLLRFELCYWNESDQKHKLIACNVRFYQDGKYSPGQFDGLDFYRYDNARKTMTWCEAPGFDVEFSMEGGWVSYDLPRTGKDIQVNYWYDSGKKTQKTLKWSGSKFSF